MKNIWVLFKKEMRDAFSSPLIYVLAGLFSLIMGWLFFNYLLAAQKLYAETLTATILVPIFGNMNFIFLFLMPLIAMKSFAEEKRRGTLELLFLSDLSEMQIIWGKFLGNLAVTLFLLLFTLVFPVILSFSGYSDWGCVTTSYLGIILSIMCYLAVSLFASSLTSNPIIAAVLSFCILLCLLLLVLSANATNNYLIGMIFRYISVPFHYEGMARGVIKSFNLVYFASFIGFFIFLTKRSLSSRNW